MRFAKSSIALFISLASASEVFAQSSRAHCNSGTAPFKIALVSSGGISKGAYQAGALWAFLQHERAIRERGEPAGIRLQAAVGASAGNVNSLLVPIEWARRTRSGSTERESLLWKVWTELGVKDLLPSGKNRNRRLASLLSTSAFDESVNALTRSQSDDLLQCRVSVAITMTRADSVTLVQVPGVRDAAIMRHVSYVDFISDSTGWRLQSTKSEPKLGGTGVPIAPPPNEDGSVSLSAFLPHVLASAAFPGAFPPRRAAFVRVGREEVVDTAVFLDGGVFDNEPIGVARTLLETKDAGPASSEPACERRPSGASQCQIAFVSPNRLRLKDRPADQLQGFGSPSTLKYVADTGEVAVSISQLLRFAALLQRSAADLEISRLELTEGAGGRSCTVGSGAAQSCIAASNRLFPIFGTTAASFGAFLSKSMREHDFLVGVYDGLLAILKVRYPQSANDGTPTCNLAGIQRQGETIVDCLPELSETGKAFILGLYRREFQPTRITDAVQQQAQVADVQLRVLQTLADTLYRAAVDAEKAERLGAAIDAIENELYGQRTSGERRRELKRTRDQLLSERIRLIEPECRSGAAVIGFACNGGLLAAIQGFSSWYNEQSSETKKYILTTDVELAKVAEAPIAVVYDYAVEVAFRARLLQDRELSWPLRVSGRFLELGVVKSRTERANAWWRPVYSTPGEPAERWGWGWLPPLSVSASFEPKADYAFEWMPLGALFTRFGAIGPVYQPTRLDRANVGLRYQTRFIKPFQVHSTVLAGTRDFDQRLVVRPQLMVLARTFGFGPEWHVRHGDWGAPRWTFVVNDIPALVRLYSAPR